MLLQENFLSCLRLEQGHTSYILGLFLCPLRYPGITFYCSNTVLVLSKQEGVPGIFFALPDRFNFYKISSLMAENKKSFILYADMLSTVEKLPDDTAGKLIKIILQYVNDKNPEVEDLLLQIAFEPIKQQLKRDLKDWEETKTERVKSGRLGGIKSGESRRSKQTKQVLQNRSKVKQNEANEAVSVTVNVNESVKEERAPVNDLTKSNLFRKPTIPTKKEVLMSFIQNGGDEEMSNSFFERCEATEWYFKGSPITNFRNLVGSFVTNWKNNLKGKIEERSTSAPLRRAN